MTAVLAALASVALAGLVGLAGVVNPPLLAAAVGLVVLVVALGSGVLLGLPHPNGSALLVLLTGWAGVAVTTFLPDVEPLGLLAAFLALSLLLAFAHELLRRDGRVDLVESVTGTVAAQVCVLLAAGWVLLPGTALGRAAVFVAAVSVGVARAATALPLRGWPGAWVPFVAGIAGAVVAAQFTDPVRLVPALATGVVVSAAAAGLDRLLRQTPGARTPLGLLAAAAAPVSAVGTVAYAVSRLVTG
ncbi:hypothetical protein [Kineosporia sp. R_H_3]|uniref:hypothetical protein n=1 Tax=Kineosporia sp. R_H_3 TaxID=1961848 RepID=UPI00117A4100|nr:hypothetical protein [Kineosporia sp. R_H_3]MBI4940143.1 hypothetical protein [Actinomycetota bacterium]